MDPQVRINSNHGGVHSVPRELFLALFLVRARLGVNTVSFDFSSTGHAADFAVPVLTMTFGSMVSNSASSTSSILSRNA